MKKIKLSVIVALSLVLGGMVWIGLALGRTCCEHRSLMNTVESGLPAGTGYAHYVNDLRQADLRIVHSMGPFLKKPWRHDVRLYYSNKQSGRDLGYATREGHGEWYVKIWD